MNNDTFEGKCTHREILGKNFKHKFILKDVLNPKVGIFVNDIVFLLSKI